MSFLKSVLPLNRNFARTKPLSLTTASCFKRHSTEKVNNDSPVKFSTSRASKWRAQTSRSGIENPRLWYEPYVIIASISVFMIYFTMLREENDYDLELTRTLYSRIEGLEEQQLREVLDYNDARGLETADILKRLNELEGEKLDKQT